MATILYVDDELSVQRVVRLWLGRRGHEVHTASNVAEAQRLLGEAPVDVVLLDIWLGTESGFEVQAWIDEQYPALAERVAFVTGDIAPDERHANRLLALGRPVFTKPFDFGAIEATIAEWAT